MQFEVPTLFSAVALGAAPNDVSKAAARWNEETGLLVDAVNVLASARERARVAVQKSLLPDAADRRAGPRLKEALAELLTHLHGLEEVRAPVAEALVKAAKTRKALADRALDSITSKLCTLGYDDETARRCATWHPTVREHCAGCQQADAALGQLPNTKGGSVLRLAVAVEAELAGLEG